MSAIELVVMLLAVSASLQVLARRINVPHPVLLVLGGLALALIPGLPRITIAPDTLFLIFVPPLLYWAALTTSFRDFTRQASPIARYATLVVLLTMAAVAVVVHALLPEFTWGAAFLLGAIVAPPDPVAAIAVLRPLGAPREMVMILEGEGLMNDATALVSYRIALAAVVTGAFSIGHAAASFVLAATVGVLVGFAVGWVVAFARRHLIGRYPIVENTISLLTPFFAYLPAEWLKGSGVLAVVTIGLYLGRRGPRIMAPATRVQEESLWTVVQFLLESLIFILIGLELPVVVHSLRAGTMGQLIRFGAVLTATVILVRIAYTMIAMVLLRIGARRRGRTAPPWSQGAFVGWMGIRGGDSLVIALALPVATAAGAPFPARGPIIFLTFVVILGTLVIQGATAVPLLHVLKIREDGAEDAEEAHARRVKTELGLRVLEEATVTRGTARLIADLRAQYEARLKKWAARDAAPVVPADDGGVAPASADAEAERTADAYRALRRTLIATEREAVIGLRDRDEISDDVLRRLQRELDLESMMLDSIEDDASEPYEEDS